MRSGLNLLLHSPLARDCICDLWPAYRITEHVFHGFSCVAVCAHTSPFIAFDPVPEFADLGVVCGFPCEFRFSFGEVLASSGSPLGEGEMS